MPDQNYRPRIRLALFDMDGTLLDSRKSISDSVKQALKHACDQGIACAFGTGRSVAELSVYPELFSLLRYGVCESGALLYDFVQKKILSSSALPEEVVRRIGEVSAHTDMAMQFFAEGKAYIQEDHVEHIEQYQMGQYKELYRQIVIKPENILEELQKHPGKIEKINLFHKSQEDRAKTRALVSDLQAEIVDSEITSLEFSPMGVSKGSGLMELGRILGADASECAAVGDANNDLPMLRTAGLSIAMGNANEEVKAIADVVVADNDHEGIAEAVDLMLSYGAKN